MTYVNLKKEDGLSEVQPVVIPVASGVVRIGEWRQPLPGPL